MFFCLHLIYKESFSIITVLPLLVAPSIYWFYILAYQFRMNHLKESKPYKLISHGHPSYRFYSMHAKHEIDYRRTIKIYFNITVVYGSRMHVVLGCCLRYKCALIIMKQNRMPSDARPPSNLISLIKSSLPNCLLL